MIKVEKTKPYKDKLVAEAKLLLVECTTLNQHLQVNDLVTNFTMVKEYGIVIKANPNTNGIFGNAKIKFKDRVSARPTLTIWEDIHNEKRYSSILVKPILISKTEKLEVDDWTWDDLHKLVFKATKETCLLNRKLGAEALMYKVLALKEHFSPEQLQMIVDGKLKNGDKVLVECTIDTTIPEPHNCEVIKLNPHITLYPVEEKMIPLEPLKDYINQRLKGITNNWDFNLGGKAAYESILQWLEENV